MNKVITVTTDFGDAFAAAQLKAVAASLGFCGQIIENHSVTPFSIGEGAFQIALLSHYSPQNAVHVGVVDPGVGSARRGIIVQTEKSWLVGPDNGLFYPTIQAEGVEHAWQIKESEFGEVSDTFHGRDIFIKSAVYLAQGKRPEDFNCIKTNSNTLKKYTFISGQVLHVDAYGNVKVYWDKDIHTGESLVIRKNGTQIISPVVRTFTEVGKGKPLVYLGSSDTLEFAINLGNAAKEFDIKVDDILDIRYNVQESRIIGSL